MTVLIIIAVILLVISSLLFLPVDLYIEFKEEFNFKIKFSMIKVFPTRSKKQTEEQAAQNDISAGEKDVGKDTDKLFAKLKKKYGFFGAVKELLKLFSEISKHLTALLTHIKFKSVKLSLSVAAENAAVTAIEYGACCALVYPLLSFIEANAAVKYKQIDVKSDFENKKPDFYFSLVTRLNIFYLSIAAFKSYSDYKNFKARIEANE